LPDVLESLRAVVLFEQSHSELDHLINGHHSDIFSDPFEELSGCRVSSLVGKSSGQTNVRSISSSVLCFDPVDARPFADDANAKIAAAPTSCIRQNTTNPILDAPNRHVPLYARMREGNL
jgi:hypothetical protein